MINLPAYSGAAFLALILGDILMLILFSLAAGPVFLHARDAFGRPLEPVSLIKRLLLVVATLGFAAYLAAQAALVWNFTPYFFDSQTTATEQVMARSIYPATGTPVARWITTETHRFGVTESIFKNLAVGDVVEFRFRAIDDTLYEIHVVRYNSGASPAPGTTPAGSPTP